MEYLLLLSMKPSFFVEAFHVHKKHVCVFHERIRFTRHGSADRYAVCLFTLSSFAGTESSEYNHALTVKLVEYLFLEDGGVTACVSLLALRAPPFRMS